MVLKEVPSNNLQDRAGPEELSEELTGLDYLGQFKRNFNRVIRGLLVVIIKGVWALQFCQLGSLHPIGLGMRSAYHGEQLLRHAFPWPVFQVLLNLLFQ